MLTKNLDQLPHRVTGLSGVAKGPLSGNLINVATTSPVRATDATVSSGTPLVAPS